MLSATVLVVSDSGMRVALARVLLPSFFSILEPE
jgi:hypothetical protein